MLKKLFANAKVRLVGRAVVAGLAVALTQASDSDYSSAALKGALTAGVFAAIEVLTPLNSLIGVFKQ